MPTLCIYNTIRSFTVEREHHNSRYIRRPARDGGCVATMILMAIAAAQSVYISRCQSISQSSWPCPRISPPSTPDRSENVFSSIDAITTLSLIAFVESAGPHTGGVHRHGIGDGSAEASVGIRHHVMLAVVISRQKCEAVTLIDWSGSRLQDDYDHHGGLVGEVVSQRVSMKSCAERDFSRGSRRRFVITITSSLMKQSAEQSVRDFSHRRPLARTHIHHWHQIEMVAYENNVAPARASAGERSEAPHQ